MLVRSGDVMAACLQHPGQRSHRSATDSDQVIVHIRLPTALRLWPRGRPLGASFFTEFEQALSVLSPKFAFRRERRRLQVFVWPGLQLTPVRGQQARQRLGLVARKKAERLRILFAVHVNV